MHRTATIGPQALERTDEGMRAFPAGPGSRTPQRAAPCRTDPPAAPAGAAARPLRMRRPRPTRMPAARLAALGGRQEAVPVEKETRASRDAPRTLLQRPLRRRAKRGVADAIVEAYPVDAGPAARCVAVAQVDTPIRRPLLLHVAQGAGHGSALLSHAALLPLADETDVQGCRVVERRLCARLRDCGRYAESRDNDHPPH